MAFFEDRLSLLQEEVVAGYFAMLREAEAHRMQETAAVVRIQSAWRGFYLRRSLARLAATCTTIQRCYRGHRGRRYAAAFRRKRDHELRMAYFDAAATTIQRHFRGYHSRKYKHSYYARAAYIAAVMHTTQRLRAQLQESFEQQAARHAEEEAQREAAQYQLVLRQSHHLVSTRSCPGVFCAPRYATGLPKLNGLSVEEHLWQTVRATRSPAPCSDIPTPLLRSESVPTSTPSSVVPVEKPAARVKPLNLAPLNQAVVQNENSVPRSSSRGASISELIQRAAEYETVLRAASPSGTQRSGYLSGRNSSHAHTPSSRLSVQAASPYISVEDTARLVRQESARLAVSARPFLTAVGTDRLNTGNVNGGGISEGTRYGIEEETKKVEQKKSKQLMRQISPEPFRVAARAQQLFEDAPERVVVL